ncbi:MAG: undecaprenyl-diphosphate phosphatase [Candidatus Methanomethyliales bacterium]|nr:undecaprenyl-diphosphate phosphatase [Candidatus Methanomethylicales archaeon]
MDLFEAVLLAVIQGLTEWLPISSSGHLVLVQTLIGLDVPLGFYTSLHLGTLLAVVVYFRVDLLRIISAFLRGDVESREFRLGLYVISGSIPTVILALVFRGFFESLFSSPLAVVAGLTITGVLLLFSKFGGRSREVDLPRSLLIGLFQGFAIAPGISRSGATISVALASGIQPKEAFRYSFILSIPTIIGANLLEFGSTLTVGFQSIIGFVVAAATGYVAIRVVDRVVLREKLHLFSVYCFSLALVCIITML